MLYESEDPRDKHVSAFKHRMVGVSEETLMLIDSGEPMKYYRFLVDDGTEWRVNADSVYELTEVYK